MTSLLVEELIADSGMTWSASPGSGPWPRRGTCCVAGKVPWLHPAGPAPAGRARELESVSQGDSGVVLTAPVVVCADRAGRGGRGPGRGRRGRAGSASSRASPQPDVFRRAIRYAAQRKHVEQASAALQRSELQAEENTRLERGLLPMPRCCAPTSSRWWPRYRPGRAQTLLGGDFYDAVVETEGRFGARGHR